MAKKDLFSGFEEEWDREHLLSLQRSNRATTAHDVDVDDIEGIECFDDEAARFEELKGGESLSNLPSYYTFVRLSNEDVWALKFNANYAGPIDLPPNFINLSHTFEGVCFRQGCYLRDFDTKDVEFVDSMFEGAIFPTDFSFGDKFVVREDWVGCNVFSGSTFLCQLSGYMFENNARIAREMLKDSKVSMNGLTLSEMLDDDELRDVASKLIRCEEVGWDAELAETTNDDVGVYAAFREAAPSATCLVAAPGALLTTVCAGRVEEAYVKAIARLDRTEGASEFCNCKTLADGWRAYTKLVADCLKDYRRLEMLAAMWNCVSPIRCCDDMYGFVKRVCIWLDKRNRLSYALVVSEVISDIDSTIADLWNVNCAESNSSELVDNCVDYGDYRVMIDWKRDSWITWLPDELFTHLQYSETVEVVVAACRWLLNINHDGELQPYPSVEATEDTY